MKRLLLGSLFALLFVVGVSSTAHATAALELVAGSGANYSTLYVSDNAAVTCSNFGSSTACGINPSADQNALVGGISLSGVVFDGYTLTITTGGSNSPNCDGFPNGPGCLNTTNIAATNISTGTATMTAYFADTGFTFAGGGFIVGFSTPGESGTTAVQTAFATHGAINPLGVGVLLPTAGLTVCGAPSLTISGPTLNTSMGTTCANPGVPVSLELATTFTTASGGAFNLNGTISSVPEPGSLMLLGSGLLGFAGFARRKFMKS